MPCVNISQAYGLFEGEEKRQTCPTQRSEGGSHKNGVIIKGASHAILAKYLFTTELSRKIRDPNITAKCFFPGATKTELQKKMPFLWRVLMGTIRPFFISTKKGAEPGIFLATSDEVEKLSGKYFNRFKEKPIFGITNEANMANQLWTLSENRSNLK